MIDITGRRYGRLITIKPLPTSKRSRYRVYWVCRCDCGEYTIVESDSLRRGKTKSCRCLNSELTAARNEARWKELPNGMSKSENEYMRKKKYGKLLVSFMVNNAIRKQYGITNAEIEPWMVELKRNIMFSKRVYRRLKKGRSNEPHRKSSRNTESVREIRV